MERLSAYFGSFLLTLTFALLPDPLVTVVTISSLGPALVCFLPQSPQVLEQSLLHRKGLEIFEHFCLEKKKKMFCFVSFVCLLASWFQLSIFWGFLILSLDRTSSNLATTRLSGPSHGKGSLGEERNPTSKYYRWEKMSVFSLTSDHSLWG